ncbi:Nitrilotriacetate monooxygenase component A [Devosia sp. DBB001]|nr:Nitrilotriacetate monooxygenase component A [Devosia sp. DBB001]
MRRRLFLTACINSTGYVGGSHRMGSGSPLRFAEYDHYLNATKIAHAGVFDAVFLSDHPALMTDASQRPLHSFDPVVLFTALAAQVPDIGFELTASSTYNSPYNLARRIATLDAISGGRTIVNIVSSFNPAVAANFGSAPLPPREARYRQAHEFMAVFNALFESWDVRPSPTAEGAWDASGAHRLDHKGEFYSVAGPLNVPTGRQGRPVMAQAGASNDGIDFAAAHGEIIYCSLLSLEAAKSFGSEVRTRAQRLGRSRASVKIVPGLVPVLGRSHKEALERHEAISETGSEEGLLRRFARDAGIDYAGLDPDAPLSAHLFQSSVDQQRPVGFTDALAALIRHDSVTARQFVRRLEGGHRMVVGTPDEVVEGIVSWWEAGAVDGYNILPPVLPDDLSEFVAEVIPRLQQRGVFPARYEGATMRERFDLPLPVAGEQLRAAP